MARDPKSRSALTRAKYLVIGVLAWVVTDPVRSESEPIPPSIQMCRSQVDDVQRLRCYDAAVDRSMQASTVSRPPRGATSAERQPAEPADEAPAPRASSSALAAPAMKAFTNTPMFNAKVAALSFRPSGAVNVTLDNGQVWTQYGPEGRVPLRAGDSVTIRPSLFGASVLVAPSGWITKVHLIPATATNPNGK
jgi:hypothetical protein